MMAVRIDHVYLWPVTMGIGRVATVEFVIAEKTDFGQFAAELDPVEEFEPIRFVANI